MKGKITDFNSEPFDLTPKVNNNEVWDDEHTEVALWQVQWDSDYGDVVNWTEGTRDAYFSQVGVGELRLPDTNFNIRTLKTWVDSENKYAGTITIDAPAESVGNYNYMSIRKYPQPVPAPDGTERQEEYFFFIREVEDVAPNTTRVFVSLDMWTTYYPLFMIEAGTLVRGHYALANTDTDTYLDAPLSADIDLTEDEPDLPHVRNTRSFTTLLSLQENNPVVCIATTADLGDAAAFMEPNGDIASLPHSWWEGTGKGADGRYPVVAVGSVSDSNASGLHVYGMTPSAYSNLVRSLRSRAPWVIKSFKAVYVLTDALVNLGSAFSFMGVSMNKVIRTDATVKIADLGITRSMFNYADGYAGFAKMYTGQFAEIIISDADGNSRSVAVEELSGKLEMYARAVSMFPFLKVQAFLTGIGGDGTKSFSVRPWTGTMDALIPGSNWEGFVFDFDIPTYTVYVDPREDVGPTQSMDKWIANRRRQVAKTTADAVADNARANDVANIATVRANAQRATNSVYEIGDDTRETNLSSGTASAQASRNTAVYSADQSKKISEKATLDQTNIEIALAMFAHDMDIRTSHQLHENLRINRAKAVVDSQANLMSSASNPLASVSGTLNVAAVNVFHGTNGSSPAFATYPWEQQQADFNYRDQGLTSEFTANSIWETDNTHNYICEYGTDNKIYEFTGQSYFRQASDANLRNSTDIALDKMDKDNAVAYSTRNRDIAIANQGYDNAINVLNANSALSSRVLANQRDVTNANADAVKTTSDSNSVRSLNLAKANAARNLALAEDEWDANYATQIAQMPGEYGETVGNGAVDALGLRGITVSVNRLSKAAERLVGDLFKVRGYRTPPTLLVHPTLRQMSRFSYWQFQEIWTNAGSINDAQENTIKGFFTRGVTVWEHPEDVKKVYLDNNPEGVK